MLREEGYSPIIEHRDLGSRPVDSLENLRNGPGMSRTAQKKGTAE